MKGPSKDSNKSKAKKVMVNNNQVIADNHILNCTQISEESRVFKIFFRWEKDNYPFTPDLGPEQYSQKMQIFFKLSYDSCLRVW